MRFGRIRDLAWCATSDAVRFAKRLLLTSLLLCAAVAVAQVPSHAACLELISSALRSSANACGSVGSNEICYGNRLSVAVPALGVGDLRFQREGDRAALAQISTLHLSPLDEIARQWGIVLMRVQARLPGTLPGQSVTFLVFGNATLETRGVSPNTDPGQMPAAAGPVQAFYFNTGIGAPTCAEAPTDGMVVQTPQGSGLVSFTLNGIDISLDSTALVSTAEDGGTSIALMDGQGSVRVNGVEQSLVAGAEVHVQAGADLLPDVEPSLPRPIDVQQMTVVSKTLDVLPRAVGVPAPATDTDLDREIEKSRRGQDRRNDDHEGSTNDTHRPGRSSDSEDGSGDGSTNGNSTRNGNKYGNSGGNGNGGSNGNGNGGGNGDGGGNGNGGGGRNGNGNGRGNGDGHGNGNGNGNGHGNGEGSGGGIGSGDGIYRI